MTLLSNKIFLIGMPGSGKSTVGRRLAEKLGYAFIDLDDEIEKKEGCTINELFSSQGEDYFRNLERKVLVKVAQTPGKFVISTGGGTPCFFDNLQVIKKFGRSVFIHTPISELISRMMDNEIAKRPKFSEEEDLQATLNKLFSERLPYYEQADYRWEGEDSIEELLKMLTHSPT